MPNKDSTPGQKPGKPVKPAKPRADFPLYAHANGHWAKKIRGKIHYFGPWADPQGALEKYLDQRDALHAGRKPKPDASGVTVKDVANAFLNAKQDKLEAGELSPRSFDNYQEACAPMVAHFGKSRLAADLSPADFADLRAKLSKRWGPVRLGTMIQNIRSAFKNAYESELLDRPVRFGPAFKGPSKKTLRLHRASRGAKLFTAGEVRLLIAGATQPLRSMILLGVNAGFGNSDCGTLPLSAVDLEGGWVSYARPKTGVARRCPLWPETVESLREAIAERPEPKGEDDAGLVFVTQRGHGWAKDTSDNPITKEMAKLMKKVGVGGRRNFYALRHTHRTASDGAKDQPAADHIMGHSRDDMASVYRESIADDRLVAVSDHVRMWLFGGVSE